MQRVEHLLNDPLEIEEIERFRVGLQPRTVLPSSGEQQVQALGFLRKHLPGFGVKDTADLERGDAIHEAQV